MPMLRWRGASPATSRPFSRTAPCWGMNEAGDGPQQRRFAAAGRAEQGHEFAACHFQVYALQRRDAAILKLYAGHGQGGLGC